MSQSDKPTYITVKDHSVSGEDFKLLFNTELDMLETFPQPSEDSLPDYYKSEDYISHTGTKRNLLEMVYHLVRKRALKQKLNLINTFTNSSKNLLDVGCGTGNFIECALHDGWSVTGIEPNNQARNVANSKTNNSVFKVEYLNELKPESFDVITLWHVLEHLPKLEMHIKLLKSLLKPNGTLVVAVPNYKSYDAEYYQKYWAAFDAPRHLWHFSRTSIMKLFNKVEMTLTETRPLKFDSYYVSLLSEKYKTGFMNPFKAFRIGYRSNRLAKVSNEYSSHIYILKSSKP